MPSGWLLAVLLLPAVSQAQSGDGDADLEPRISCTYDIMTGRRSLTCKVVGGRIDNEDDEDNEADGESLIEKMTLCYKDFSENRTKCMEGFGDTVSSEDLKPLLNFNLTIHLKIGGNLSTMINLNKIVKPRSPHVWNVTFNQKSDQAVFHIRTPYHKEYLTAQNQLFELHIWTTGSKICQNVSSSDTLQISMQHLLKDSEYHVKVRAIPVNYLQGTWSEWSENFTFFTPAGESEKVKKLTEEKQEMHTVTVCLVLLVLVTSCVVFFWKNRIFTYIWPSIPHPKHTLVQICKPNKGLLLNFKPEVFSALKVYPVEKTEEQPSEEPEPSIDAADAAQPNPPCSAQSSDCSRSTTSVSTEELELSALLSRSSSDGEDSLQSSSPSPVNVLHLGEGPHTPPPERSGGGNEAEAYVTMSSFYQIN
ncbi:hypothetical protein L3Q82_002223 [Scortum barcoo]|uniref:Uncharacterized protein n=1 Tax=Scortum barcoo TaxID=214431 RepID=A0ACB8W2D2_9TELE|nr:hypothetical protein L3Q82_002223 [Scortum barcoo]